jgi:hypothetical protein
MILAPRDSSPAKSYKERKAAPKFLVSNLQQHECLGCSSGNGANEQFLSEPEPRNG